MLRWICAIMLLLVVAAVVAEQYVVRTGRTVTGKPVVRVACASWQMGEMPFEPFIEAYRQTHPEVEVELAILPDDSNNKLVMLWQHDQTPYDVLIAYARPDEMPTTPQLVDSKPRSTLVERESRAARANKPKALSTSHRRKAASVEDVARGACSFV